METIPGMDAINSMNLLSNFSVSSLMAGLVFGVVGYWMWKRARKREHYPTMGIAAALMIYPYFTNSPFADWAVGIALCILAYQIW